MDGLTEYLSDTTKGKLWIAEVDGERVGSIAIIQDSKESAQLRWFIIDNSYQGLGIGTALLETALEYCKENEYSQVYLWTFNLLKSARHLYKKHGFILTEEQENHEWRKNSLVEERWDLNLVNKKIISSDSLL